MDYYSGDFKIEKSSYGKLSLKQARRCFVAGNLKQAKICLEQILEKETMVSENVAKSARKLLDLINEQSGKKEIDEGKSPLDELSANQVGKDEYDSDVSLHGQGRDGE